MQNVTQHKPRLKPKTIKTLEENKGDHLHDMDQHIFIYDTK